MLLCSALVSGAEVAFFSLTPQDSEALKNKRSKLSKLILKLLEKPRTLLATILITNNFINIAIVLISSLVIFSIFNFAQYPYYVGFLIEVVIVTFFLVLFGEIIPKIFAAYNNLKMARFMAYPLFYLEKLCYPLSQLLISLTRVIEKRLEKHQNVQSVSLEEIDHAIDLAVDDKTSEEEKVILKGIVKFGNIAVKQIMRSRVDIIAFDREVGFHDLLKTVKKSGYSRIPVYEENLDNILGILYAKDLLQYLEKDKDFQWQELLRPPFYIPESKKIDDLLKEFQTKRIHMAIAVDEYGGTAGLVTLEDIMEEIIGEIKDEFDAFNEIEYSKEDDNNYIFEGKTLLNDICKVLSLNPDYFDQVKGESDSLAGLILELSGEIPQKDAVIKFDNFLFTVLSVGENRIKKVKVTVHSVDAAVEVND